MNHPRFSSTLVAALSILGVASACGSTRTGFGGVDDAGGANAGGDDASGGGAAGCTSGTCDDGGAEAGDSTDAGPFVVTPANATLTVPVGSGAALPTQAFKALLASGPGASAPASWLVDRSDIGTINAGTGVFTPTGLVGGAVVVTAILGGRSTSVTLTVKLVVTQAGDPSAADADAGAGSGGYGGVGGAGVGGAATPAQMATLDSPAKADAALAFLYPYNQTVWPRGTLAPLLQWQAGSHRFDSVRIQLHEANYDYAGYFQMPAAATTFVNHPIPQAIWKQVASSNAGEPVTITLTFGEKGVTYGPLEETWTISKGNLAGTLYYESYGTKLVLNSVQRTITGGRFGGATLAVRGRSTSPTLIAGTNTDDDTGCRVCHSVSANGKTLITQHGDDYNRSSVYDLTQGNAETVVSAIDDGSFWFPGLSPDGSQAFASSVAFDGTALTGGLYGIDGAPAAATGLPAGLRAFTPAFSPDGTHVAYGDLQTGGLGLIDVAALPKTFSNARQLFAAPTGQNVYWPSFLPNNNGVVFELEIQSDGRPNERGATRSQCDDPSDTDHCGDQGTRAELWWVDVATGKAARLDRANGLGYLPNHPSAFVSPDKDNELNYEPTVYPVSSDGYAWVVFTSRRLYGNVATINPYWSDPRYHDISTTENATTKKLWVAAIDLNAPPGTDPSHPAFYLPAQELLAGNARGFWVVDTCEAMGTCDPGQ